MSARSLTVTAAGQGRRIALVGDVYRCLASGDDTGGRYALFEATISPGGGPPLHVHSREEEGFLVIEGEVTFYTDDGSVCAGPGTFLNLPIGVRHRFRNESDRVARMLVFVSPAGLEKMFEQAGTSLSDATDAAPPVTQADIERVVRVAAEFGITVFPPGA